MQKTGKAILSVLFISWFLFPSEIQAAWTKKGPIEIEELGTLEVLVHQVDAVSVQVTLLDAQEKVIQTLRAEERIARFTMVHPGTYFIFVQTNGYDPLQIYHSFAGFASLTEPF